MTFELKNKNDHSSNFKLILDSLLNYIKCKEKETTVEHPNFESLIEINKIIEKNESALINLANLLILISSLSSKKDKKVIIADSKGMAEISEISLFLSGGDFLHKKIEILDETIIKNSEMYNSILDKYEKQLAELRQNKNDLESLTEKKNIEYEELKKKLEEMNILLNNKNNESNQLNNDFNEYKLQSQKDIKNLQEQIKNITALKEEEINLLNDKIKNEQNNQNENFENYKLISERMNKELSLQNEELKKQIEEIPLLKQEISKFKNYCNNLENENNKMKNEINICNEKIKEGEKINREMNEKMNIMGQKFNSDPYYAREIMSKTLYDFALKMMSENN